MGLIIQLNAEQTASAIFIAYFCTKSDYMANFHQLMEQMVAERWED